MKILGLSAVCASETMQLLYGEVFRNLHKQDVRFALICVPELFFPASGELLPASFEKFINFSVSLQSLTLGILQKDPIYKQICVSFPSREISRTVYDNFYSRIHSLSIRELEEYSSQGIRLAELVYHDFALSHKIHSFSLLGLADIRLFQSHILALDLLLHILESLSLSGSYDLSFCFEGYAVHSLFRLISLRSNISHRYLTWPSHAGVVNSFLECSSSSLPAARRHKLQVWNDCFPALNTLLKRSVINESLRDLTVRLQSRSPHVYSSSITLNHSNWPPTKSLFSDHTKPLVSVFTSSIDERVATFWLTMALGEILPRSSMPFENQQEWLLCIFNLSLEYPEINFLVRLHPRLDADKRGVGKSQYFNDLLEFFRISGISATCNFYICMPSDPISSYDILFASSFVVNGWSTVGLEALRLGIPVINTFAHNGSACYWPDSLFNYKNSYSVYLALVKRYLSLLLTTGIILPKPSTFLAAHAYHYYIHLATAFFIGDRDLNHTQNFLSHLLSPSSFYYSAFQSLWTSSVDDGINSSSTAILVHDYIAGMSSEISTTNPSVLAGLPVLSRLRLLNSIS